VNSGFIDLAKCQEEITDEYDSVIMRFFEGDVPMMLATGDVVSGTAKRESKLDAFTANPFKYGFYAAPAGDDGGYFINSISICFSVNKNSRNIDMTNEFMRFLISSKELGLLDPAVRQFRAAIYAVGNSQMTVDEAVAAYGSIPEE
nr:hypothetical protein [Lachnospiraceae bacterium]